jgi:hypothetical protein
MSIQFIALNIEKQEEKQKRLHIIKKQLIKKIKKSIFKSKTVDPSVIIISNKISLLRNKDLTYFNMLSIERNISNKITYINFFKWLNDNSLIRITYLKYPSLNYFLNKLTILQLQSILINLKNDD